MNLYKLKELVIFLVFTLFLFTSISAYNYFIPDKVFNSDLIYVNDIKAPYSVILNIENTIKEKLYYEIEIFYEKENIVVGYEDLYCNNKCEIKIDLKRIFFDEHKIKITANYKNNKYVEEHFFKIDEQTVEEELLINPIYYIKEGDKSINITGIIRLMELSDAIIEIYPLINEKNRYRETIQCKDLNCRFNIELKSQIVLSEYMINVYLPNLGLTKKFKIELGEDPIDKLLKGNKNNQIDFKKLSYNIEELEIVDLFGNIKNLSDIDDLEDLSKYREIKVKNERTIVKKLVPQIKSISNSEEKKRGINKSNDEKLDKNAPKVENSGFMLMSDDFSIMSVHEEVNPIKSEENKLYIYNDNYYIELKDESSTFFNESSGGFRPGLYKNQKIKRYEDGTKTVEENYFAYGLVSINTKKPLYKLNEKVELLIVVLDSGGYLVSDAPIILNITKPNGENKVLKTSNLDIIETDFEGVYKAQINSTQLGKYNLSVKTLVSDMILTVDSFFNVVEDYEFDIIREVPVTIDPWEGPFQNIFHITPRVDYDKYYNFTEVFSSDFDIIDTDADKIEIKNKKTYLNWYNLSSNSTLFYIAQTPLKTPYLYYLGKSFIDYNDGLDRFYENRSWLFAIDPAARVCGFTSPCICGAACAGGNEPGSGTIDGCTDGNVDYEWTNDIRVRSLNGSYFGVGDTVEICVDSNCDSAYGGNRVSIGYKTEETGWLNSHVLFQTGNTGQATACVGLQTYCVEITLDDYAGAHHVRGSTVYQQGLNNQICFTATTWRDHDDIEFIVLDKVPPSVISWNLNNGTHIGNNLRVIRGSNINMSALWDLPLQSGRIIHNSTGNFETYNVNSFINNQTNYLFNTNDLTLFSNLGPISIDLIQASDLYFNLEGNSTDSRNFNIYAEVEVSQTLFELNVGYSGLISTMECKVGDFNIEDVYYENILVEFYKDDILIGTNLTNSTGWSQFTFPAEDIVGEYEVKCSIPHDDNTFVTPSIFANSTREQMIRNFGEDISKPEIIDVSISNNLFSVGGVTIIDAEAIDDVGVEEVILYVIFPDSSVGNYTMDYIGGDNYTYTFIDTTQEGRYRYFIIAYDEIRNPSYYVIRTFKTVGVSSFIGIQSSQSLFKLGQSLNLTNYEKILDIENTIYEEEGDINNIFYSFNDGAEGWTTGGTHPGDWQRGVPTQSFLNECDDGDCFVTRLNNNYRSNTNIWLRSPLLDFTGRTNLKITYWRKVQIQDGVNTDRFFFEGSNNDGSSWNIYFQDSLIGGGSTTYVLNAGTTTVYPTELEGNSDIRLQFRLTSNPTNNFQGAAVDSVNITFNPRVNWIKDWNFIDSPFGSDVDKITAIKISFNITNYNASGSLGANTNLPDLEFQVFNGTDYSDSYFCNLDDAISYPYICEITIKNTPEYLDSWLNNNNRNIRFRAINLDMGDSIEWSNIKREYITPSIIENNGEGQMTAYLLQQFRNSTGGVVETLYFQPISLSPDESRQLSDFWTYNIAGDFQLGEYQAYVALTDANRNVLINEDEGTLIEDVYIFEINSLIINLLNPLRNSVQNESYRINISLDTTSYGFGGWCGYSLNGAPNVTLNNPSLNYLESDLLVNQLDLVNNQLEIFCNDTDGDMATTGIINFNISQPPRVEYNLNSDGDGLEVNREWFFINVTINDSTFNTSWVEFEDNNYTINNCNFIGGSTNHCFINMSNILNGIYNYRVCANDTLNNIACSLERTININKTIPEITLIFPNNNYKYNWNEDIFFNISTFIEADNVWFELNNNGSNISLTQESSLIWNYLISNLDGANYYNISIYANDSIGNMAYLNFSFYIIPYIQNRIQKNIQSIGENNYLVTYNLTRFGSYEKNNHLKNLIPNFFTINSIIPINNDMTNINLGYYTGDMYLWNFMIVQNESQIVEIDIVGIDNYNLSKLWLIGIK